MSFKDGWIDDEGSDYLLRLMYNRLWRDLGTQPFCCVCRRVLDFEEWKKGGQGYCERCFNEIVKGAIE